MRRALIGLFATLTCVRAAELPARVDNSLSPAFPPVIRQTHESCAQDVGLSTMMTYVWNRHHGTSAAEPNNRFAGPFIWNFLNRGENRGAELVEGWHLARAIGVPRVPNYPQPDSLGEWPNGYAIYYGAMKHRVRSYHSFPLNNEEQLLVIKQKLNQGVLFGIEGRLRGSKQVTVPEGKHEAGKQLVLRWGRKGIGHVMTYVGYDENVGHDLNGDGQLTNDLDLNGDGALTLADWERGAFIAVNSYGHEWGDAGKCYVLFRESAVTPFKRGRWASTVEILPAYEPLLTLRLKLQTTCQSAIRLRIQTSPDQTYSPLLFDLEPPSTAPPQRGPNQHNRFVTGKRRLSLRPARRTAQDRVAPVELGLDLTGQLPLQAANYRLLFRLDQRQHPTAAGTVLEASLLHYYPDGRLITETAFSGLPKAMSSAEHVCQSQP